MRIRAMAIAIGLIAAGGLAAVQSANAEDLLAVPKTSFPVCSATRTDYCVESVVLSSPGAPSENLVFQAYGTVLPAPAPVASPEPSPSGSPSPSSSPAPSPSDSATPAPVASPTPSASPTITPAPIFDPSAPATVAGATVGGQWTTPSWIATGHGALGYNGLHIDVKAVNAFDNHIYMQVKGTKIDAANVTTLAKMEGTNTPVSLNLDDVITVKIKTKNFKPGVTIAFANNVKVDRQGDGSSNSMIITAQPIPLAMAKAVADCTGENGVALYTNNGIGVFVAATNDPSSGFGVDGVSGDMVVSTNGMCSTSTPTWDAATKSLNWVAAAPHFAEDGKSINQGAYKAMIPVADAKLLWGLENPQDAVTDLAVSMTTDINGTAVNTVKSIAVKNGFIIISSTGYQYSKPKFKLYKKASKVKTITCVKGKTTKKVTAAKPVCPKGYKQK